MEHDVLKAVNIRGTLHSINLESPLLSENRDIVIDDCLYIPSQPGLPLHLFRGI